jgi:hypothetical protein
MRAVFRLRRPNVGAIEGSEQRGMIFGWQLDGRCGYAVSSRKYGGPGGEKSRSIGMGARLARTNRTGFVTRIRMLAQPRAFVRL